MLKTTFPHMGTLYIPMKSFLYELGLDPVVPPPTSQRTISLGTSLAPEFACLPLKVNLGNYIEAIEAGAEIILMAGGVGPCRFGYYSQVQQKVLAETGYRVELVTLEAPNANLGELLRKIKKYLPRRSPNALLHALRLFWTKARMIDNFDRLANMVRPREYTAGTTNRLQTEFYYAIDNTTSLKDLKTIFNQSIEALKAVSVFQDPSLLRVMLVGEIYMVLEPRVNFQIEKSLGEMGVEVKRSIYLSDWIEEHFYLNLISSKWLRHLKQLAHPYLSNLVGGHGLESVAHAVQAGVNRMDGLIQLAPFTCMPEIIAMQTLPAVARDLSLPILHLIIDEHSGEAGIQTRLEAFIDLLKYRKNTVVMGK